ncbi:hypothetical protein AMTR_s00111p00118070 [Amborella trichopoda]|uniref:AP2/ERF domain-containing protein n=1 Tax=Amborella trichopoda TaxID=13333 RepID=W1NZW2_AMBTC|nr:hypothetical protein AMTR_s00111p00118070 [Amborella trichopoda]
MYGCDTFTALESIRRHLLEDPEQILDFPANSTLLPVTQPAYPASFYRSSSFSRLLIPCLTQAWGEAPLKEDDSQDMLLLSLLGDAIKSAEAAALAYDRAAYRMRGSRALLNFPLQVSGPAPSPSESRKTSPTNDAQAKRPLENGPASPENDSGKSPKRRRGQSPTAEVGPVKVESL